MEKIKSVKFIKKRRRIKLVIKPSESPLYIKAYEEYPKSRPCYNVSRCGSTIKKSPSPSMTQSRIIRVKYTNPLLPEKSVSNVKKDINNICLTNTIKACYTEFSKGPSFRNTKTLKKLYFSQTNSKAISPTRLKFQTKKIIEKKLPIIKSNFRLDLTSFRKLIREAPSWTYREEIPHTIERKIKKLKEKSIELKGWD
ncbi:hypothetical protein SteCoe_21281 [Stentor coeruleus]|uniref:Uncharacterized protein n=1 Tax=Stentor coeruleus TaxID=5963 RepID=A0A1R2BQ30_9CILI|nr:hypothetical protein SteCoe_21281 [Stentor coeruleus]